MEISNKLKVVSRTPSQSERLTWHQRLPPGVRILTFLKRDLNRLLHSKWLLWSWLFFFFLSPSATYPCYTDATFPSLLRCCRGAEGLPGLHPSPANERHHPRPGREGRGHAWGQARLPRPLYQFWDVLPERREVRREVQRLLVWLHRHCLWWPILHQRWEAFQEKTISVSNWVGRSWDYKCHYKCVTLLFIFKIAITRQIAPPPPRGLSGNI